MNIKRSSKKQRKRGKVFKGNGCETGEDVNAEIGVKDF